MKTDLNCRNWVAALFCVWALSWTVNGQSLAASAEPGEPLTFAVDVALLDMVSPIDDPISCFASSSAEVVTVEMQNTGLTTILAGEVFAMTYQVDAQPVVTEFYFVFTPFLVGEVRQFTFPIAIDLSTPGTYSITTRVSYAVDPNANNDALTQSFVSGGQLMVSTFPYTEDFTLVGVNGGTELPVGFSNETADSIGLYADWFARNDGTANAGTGPVADHTGGTAGLGGYLYVDDIGNQPAISLRSPCFDLSGLCCPRLSFFMHSLNITGGNPNKLSVDVISYPSGSITVTIFGPIGDTGSSWTHQHVDLSAFAGQLIQVVIRAQTISSFGSVHDIAIDDLSIVELLPTPGQSPQMGQATLDLNNPINANADPLDLAFGGPYFTDVNAGSSLIFKMIGQSFAPIILLGGPLNPVVANFTNIGTFDIGGPPHPVTGVPTLLTLYADGFSPYAHNPLFVTSATGEASVPVTVPSLPPGILGSFQCVFRTTGIAGHGLALSNAVQVTIL